MTKKLLYGLTFAAALSASTNAWAQLTDGGVYYLKNVETGTFLGAGNNWGTRASLLKHGDRITLHSQGDNAYTLESRSGSAGKGIRADGFMDQTPINFTITASGDYYTIANGANYMGSDGTAVVNMGLTTVNDAAKWQFIKHEDAISALSAATVDQPLDATFLILDAGFTRANRDNSAWTIVNAGRGNLDYHVNHCLEAWKKTFSVSQTLTELPDGVYGLSVQGFYRVEEGSAGSLPYVYAGEKSNKVDFPLLTGSDNSLTDASGSFNTKDLYHTSQVYARVDNGTLEIGAASEVTNLWQVFDNFELTYYGDVSVNQVLLASYIKSYKAAFAEAQEAAAQDMTAENRATIDAKITEKSVDVASATQAQLETAVSDMQAIVEEANGYAEEYAYQQKLAALTEAGTGDATFTIVNPSFESQFTGWTNNGFQTQANASFTSKDGNLYAEKYVWNGSTLDNATITQTINGLPAGVYTLKAVAHNTQTDAAAKGFFLTANSKATEVGASGTYTVNVVLNEGDALTIGAKTEDCTGNWVAFDNFTLEKVSANVLADELVASYDNTAKMGNDAKEAVEAAVAAVKAASTEEAKMALINNLDDAISAANASAEAYAALNAVLPTYKSNFTSREAYTTETFTAATEAETAYTAGTLTTAQAQAAVVGIADDYATYLREIAAEKKQATAFVTNEWVYADALFPDENAISKGEVAVGELKATADFGAGEKLREAWRSGGLGQGTISQTIKNLPAGKYALKAVAFTRNNDAADNIYIKTSDDNKATFQLLKGSYAYISLTDPIEVKAGDEVEIGIYINGNKSNWGGIGKVELLAISLDDETRAPKSEASKFGTICLPYNATVKSGATVYTAALSEDKNSLELTEATTIEAGKAYIYSVEGDAQAFEATLDADLVAEAETAEAGALQGTLVQTTAGEGNYVLQTQDAGQAFYIIQSGTVNVPAYRAYLTPGASGVRVQIGGTTTGVDALEALTSGKAEIFDLNGRKLNKLQKGVNIVNGAKVVVK